MVDPVRVLNDANASVVLVEHETPGGYVVAEAVLNAEATLNSLTSEMIDVLQGGLERWRDDGKVVCVVFSGAGDRAFCAGGDIQALYQAMARNHTAGKVVDEYPFRFFEREYRLDYLVHTYSKPTVVVGHGVVMGGGLGIFSGARHRVVTERSRIAFPEVTIGLFPDAGGTWMLRNLPVGVAAFLGCTGSQLNGADALAIGVANAAVADAERASVTSSLRGLDYTGGEADGALIDACIDSLPRAEMPGVRVSDVPESMSLEGTYDEVCERLLELQESSDWIDKGLATMRAGCPTSVGIVIEQLRRAPAMELAECFQMEMTIATHCALFEDFAEGVRALLVDKDNAPKWRYPTTAELDAEHVSAHFQPPWADNPLSDL